MRAYRARKSEDPAYLAKEAERVRVSIFILHYMIINLHNIINLPGPTHRKFNTCYVDFYSISIYLLPTWYYIYNICVCFSLIDECLWHNHSLGINKLFTIFFRGTTNLKEIKVRVSFRNTTGCGLRECGHFGQSVELHHSPPKPRKVIYYKCKLWSLYFMDNNYKYG